jgi:hypothetical protein
LTYIQVEVTVKRRVDQCRVWCIKVEYSPDEIVPFALEHNERKALRWSQTGEDENQRFVVNLVPGHPAIRFSVAIYDTHFLQFETEIQTPTNLLQKLQRPGVHRFTLQLTGIVKEKAISKELVAFVHWHGPGQRHVLITKS